MYTINETKFFTFGGASSHDINDGILDPNDPHFYRKKRILDRVFGMYRINHFSWWEEELPSQEEMDEGIRNLEANDWNVDLILTHCAPTSMLGVLGNGLYKPDRLNNYLETIRQHCSFKHWYCGHYHINQSIDPQFTVLYDRIKEIKQI